MTLKLKVKCFSVLSIFNKYDNEMIDILNHFFVKHLRDGLRRLFFAYMQLKDMSGIISVFIAFVDNLGLNIRKKIMKRIPERTKTSLHEINLKIY